MIISVITPYYFGYKYIDRLLKTIDDNSKALIELEPNVEIEYIIVNDSPEEELNITNPYKSFKLRVLTYEVNRGIHGARSYGIRHSHGSYLLMLDQDDIIDSKFLLEQYRKINNSDVIICNALMEKEDNSCEKLYKTQFDYFKVLNEKYYLLSHNQIASPGQCLIKRESIPEEWLSYNTTINGSDDLLLWVLMLEKHAKFSVNKSCLYKHVYTGKNQSANESQMNNSSLEITAYLKNINYVLPRTVTRLIRSRKFDKEWLSKNNRMILIFKYYDIFFPRVWWKIKGSIIKQFEAKN